MSLQGGSVVLDLELESSRFFNDLRTQLSRVKSELASINRTRISPDTSGLSRIKNEVSGVGSGFKGLRATASGALAGIGFSAALAGVQALGAGLKSLTIGGFQKSMALDTLMIQLEGLKGSTKEAQATLEMFDKFAAKSPFEQADVRSAGLSLLSYNQDLNTQQLQKKLEQVSNVAAGSGANVGELATITGRIDASDVAFMEDLNQLQDRNIPIMAELAKQYETTTAGVKELASEGKITAKDINEALDSMTTGTGVYAGAVDKMGQTLEGKLSSLKDRFTEVQTRIGQLLTPAAIAGIDFLSKQFTDLGSRIMPVLNEFASDFQAFLAENPELVAAITRAFQTLVSGGLNIVGATLKLLWQLGSNFFNILNQPEVIDAITSGLNSASAVIKVMVDSVTALINGFKVAAEWAGKVGGSVINSTVGFVTGGRNAAESRARAAKGQAGRGGIGYDVATDFWYDDSPSGSYDYTLLDPSTGSANVPVPSMFAGTVLDAGWNSGGYGNYVRVQDQATGLVSFFAHLASLAVKAGDVVSVGQTLGIQGTTGNSSGEHVHAEIRGAGGSLFGTAAQTKRIANRAYTEPLMREYIQNLRDGNFGSPNTRASSGAAGVVDNSAAEAAKRAAEEAARAEEERLKNIQGIIQDTAELKKETLIDESRRLEDLDMKRARLEAGGDEKTLAGLDLEEALVDNYRNYSDEIQGYLDEISRLESEFTSTQDPQTRDALEKQIDLYQEKVEFTRALREEEADIIRLQALQTDYLEQQANYAEALARSKERIAEIDQEYAEAQLSRAERLVGEFAGNAVQRIQGTDQILGAQETQREALFFDFADGVIGLDEYYSNLDKLDTITKEKLQSLKDETKTLSQEVLTDLNEGFKDLFTDIITGAGSAQEALANLLNSLANKFLNYGMNTLFSFLPGGANAAGGYIPNYASGNVGSILSAAVRESAAMPSGASLVMANSTEAILNRGQQASLATALSNRGGSIVNSAITINNQGAELSARARQEIQGYVKTIANNQINNAARSGGVIGRRSR